MKRNWMDYVIVAAVVACCIVLVSALTIALSGSRMKKSTRQLSIDFPDVAGVQLHSDLRYAGAPAGEVIEIRALTASERTQSPTGAQNAIRVSVRIRDDIPPIPNDTKAYVGSDTLLSDKFVGLTPGTPGAPPLSNDAVLPGTPSFNLDTLGEKLEPLLTNLNLTVIDIRANLNELLPEIRDLAKDFQTTSERATKLIDHAEKLISDNEKGIHDRIEELGTVLENLNSLLADSQKTVGNANKFISSTDREVQARMQELSVVLQNLKVATTQAKAITQTIGEKPSRLIWGFGKPAKLTPEREIIRSKRPVPPFDGPGQ